MTTEVSIGTILESKTKITSPWQMFQLVVLSKDETLASALKKLAGHKILSAPIKYSETQYVLIDIMDIIGAALPHLGTDIKNFFSTATVGQYCQPTEANVFVQMDWTQSLNGAIRTLSIGSHRFLVVNPEDRTPAGILSQLDVIKYITKNWDYIPNSLRESPLAQVMAISPACVKTTDIVKDVIVKCLNKRYQGVGVVNELGQLVANFSISDLRAVSVDNMEHLMNLTLEKFFKETKQMLLKEVVCLSANDKFIDAVIQMNNHHIHRVYVVDHHKNPIGILTATDAMYQIAKFKGAQSK